MDGNGRTSSYVAAHGAPNSQILIREQIECQKLKSSGKKFFDLILDSYPNKKSE